MRISRIEYNGFRRLADTATNIDGALTAFVGFNEAGKTSILQSLAWFSAGGSLPEPDYNRNRPPAESAAVVKVFFELDDQDMAALAEIPMDHPPASLIMHKKRDGGRVFVLRPNPRWPSKPFKAAEERLAKAARRLARQLDDAADDEVEDPNDWAAVLAEALSSPHEWPEPATSALLPMMTWLRETPAGLKHPRDSTLADMLDEVHELVSGDSPSNAAWEVLQNRLPALILFQDDDRLLETSYELHPDQRAELQPAVKRLLALAGVDLDEMWAAVQSGHPTKRESALEHGNDRLKDLFNRAWNQSKVTVRLNITGTRLEVLIKELDGDGDVTSISERSDGLKAFVALVAFIESGDHKVPPVLLVDEAEQHLHYDAQADLVSALLKSVDTTQVFYTTHSPGCLPADLGTGIRVVARDAEHADASVIKNNFWEGEGPGFSPLLFAMGAGAAAFSVCRNAVLAEGASDMVLLPTLIRQAAGVSDLDYQVAPGLANAHGSGIRVEEVAAKVVYLTDGDDGGKEHQTALKAVGVDPARIFSLPAGFAVEDLVERDDYIEVVNDFLGKMGQGKLFTSADVSAGTPIAKSFADWAKTNNVRTPSKVEVGYALLGKSDLRLRPVGKNALIRLHAKFSTAFEAPAPSGARVTK